MQIYGSKKGQGKQRQPVIAPDSAQSKTYINMLFGLGEGEILGLANGYKSVYLDDTPLQNDNGELNFPNVKVDFRNGTNDQTYIDGFPDVSSETAVNVELKHGTPFVKAFNNLDLDALRVRLKWGALRSQNAENGDVNGVKIDYAIDLKTDNGGWVQVLSPSVNAKTSDGIQLIMLKLSKPFKVIGFDPSLNNWGFSIGLLDNGLTIIETGVLKSKPDKTKRKQNLKDFDRCKELYTQLQALAKDCDLLCVELPHGSKSSRAMVSYAVCVAINNEKDLAEMAKLSL